MQLFITPDSDEAEEETPLQELFSDPHTSEGDKKRKPIVLIEIRVNHFLDNYNVSPSKAISETDKPCTYIVEDSRNMDR